MTADASPPDTPRLPSAAARVLLVDDHALVRDGLKWILSASDALCVAAEASDGIEALERLREQPFDVVVTDLSMPRLSGLELVRRIRSEFPHMSIVVLSMHNEDQYAARCLRAGADRYLHKSLPSDDLVRCVSDLASGAA